MLHCSHHAMGAGTIVMTFGQKNRHLSIHHETWTPVGASRNRWFSTTKYNNYRMNLVNHAEPRWMVRNGPHLPWHHQAAIAASKAAHLRHKTFASQGRWQFGRIAAAREFIRWLTEYLSMHLQIYHVGNRWSRWIFMLNMIGLVFSLPTKKKFNCNEDCGKMTKKYACRNIWSGCSKSCSPSTKTRLGAWDFNTFH